MESRVRRAVVLIVACASLTSYAQQPPPPQEPAPTGQPSTSQAAELEAIRDDIRKTLGLLPTFMKALPDRALPGAWTAMKGLQLNPDTAVPQRFKELIGLAVAAQIPCKYCTYFHTQAARMNGATDEQVKEAIATSALTRQWSTILNGSQQDMTAFRSEADKLLAGGAVGGAGQAGQPGRQRPPVSGTAAPGALTTQQALQDVRAPLGLVPTFIRNVPDAAISGFWREWKAMDYSGPTAIPAKYKSLISLAVASQIPCAYCVYIDRKAAEQAGASEQEIEEAIAMAAITRHWSTVLNGSLIDENQFRSETRQIFRHLQQQRGRGGAGQQGGRRR